MMTLESERRPPTKETASDGASTEKDGNTVGFWALAAQGKATAWPREPERTWYR